MYLKRLDLYGFKSFPDKLKLEFNKGITAVVGPNGSGKSNISDAVRWVLGEQSAKALRGGKMEDVIFNGTANRRPLNYAEVSVTIDNSDKRMPIDYTEVTVTRRMYRSGESEYFINGTQCRLKDIHEIFMDTGIGKEGYSIIGQGRIDEILSSKSDDRRLLFEEAAGIGKYKTRKNEAVAKLDKQEQNLINVNNIIMELEQHAEPLKNQAETAKRYMQLTEKLKIIDVNIFLQDSQRFDEEIEKTIANHQALTDEINEKKEEAAEQKRQNIGRKQEIESIEEKYNINIGIGGDLRSQAEGGESQIKLYEEQITSRQEDVRRLNRDIARMREKKSTLETERDRHNIRLSAINISMESEREKLAAFQTEFDKINTALSENEAQIEAYKTDLIERLKSSSAINTAKERYLSILREITARKNQIESERAYAVSQTNDKKVHIRALEKSKHAIEEDEAELGFIMERLASKKSEVWSSLGAARIELDADYRKLNERKTRQKALQDMEKEHFGLFDPARRILKLRESTPEKWSGICGAVGELLEVPMHLETAIETVLGGAIHDIITTTEEVAGEAINHLKVNKLGRCTFLPLSSVRGRELGAEKEGFAKESGFVGIARDLVSFDSRYSDVFASLLGRVIIIDNMHNAIRFAKKYGHRHRLVTLEGEMLNPGGSMTGGSISKRTNIFGRSREIKEIDAEVDALNIRIRKTEAEVKEFETVISRTDEEISVKQAERNSLHVKINVLLHDIEETKSAVRAMTEKVNDYDTELAQIKEQREESEAILDDYSRQLSALEAEVEFIQTSMEQFGTNVSVDRASRERVANSIGELKISISTMEQNAKSHKENILRLSGETDELSKEITNSAEQIQDLEQVQVEKVSYIEKQRESIYLLRERMDELQVEQNLLDMQKKQISERITAAELAIEDISGSISILQAELFKQESRKEQLDADKNKLYETMWELYEITYQAAKKYESLELNLPQLQREQRQLRSEIKDLGTVNVGAIDEYKTLNERLMFLTAQRDDVQEAKKKLMEIIAEFTLLMEKQFSEQIKIISQNFQDVFFEMFGGGSAYLKLSDENDILNSGIDIIVEPPGKKLQNMLLLSGGERALTAIALLFAILRIKPSPFCILDEIEAALDDANVKRFANYLSNFAKDTQFIVVTHRKGTMEAADTLYGVTMQEQGVSKLVSVRFSDVSESGD